MSWGRGGMVLKGGWGRQWLLQQLCPVMLNASQGWIEFKLLQAFLQFHAEIPAVLTPIISLCRKTKTQSNREESKCFIEGWALKKKIGLFRLLLQISTEGNIGKMTQIQQVLMLKRWKRLLKKHRRMDARCVFCALEMLRLHLLSVAWGHETGN